MIKKELRDRMIEEVMSEFDFEKVHAFMVINGETFYECGTRFTPTVEDLREMAPSCWRMPSTVIKKTPTSSAPRCITSRQK